MPHPYTPNCQKALSIIRCIKTNCAALHTGNRAAGVRKHGAL